jgi:hypothetical protein
MNRIVREAIEIELQSMEASYLPLGYAIRPTKLRCSYAIGCPCSEMIETTSSEVINATTLSSLVIQYFTPKTPPHQLLAGLATR